MLTFVKISTLAWNWASFELYQTIIPYYLIICLLLIVYSYLLSILFLLYYSIMFHCWSIFFICLGFPISFFFDCPLYWVHLTLLSSNVSQRKKIGFQFWMRLNYRDHNPPKWNSNDDNKVNETTACIEWLKIGLFSSFWFIQSL